MRQLGQDYTMPRQGIHILSALGRRGLMIALAISAAFVAVIQMTAPAAQAETLPTSPTWISPSAMEAAGYATAYGVSPGEAEDRLSLQRRGAEAPELLEAGLGDDYAGVWFDNAAGEFVVPHIAGAGPSNLAEALSRSGVTKFRLQTAQFTWHELETSQAQLNDLLRPLFAESLIKTAINPQANSVSVLLSEAADDRQRASAEKAIAQIGNQKVELKEEAAAAFDVSSLECTAARICGRPLRGGVKIGPKENSEFIIPKCSAGFKATGNIYGNRFLLTSGHCTDKEAQWWTEDPEHGAKLESIGTLEEKVYPGGDWAKYNANGTYWDTESWPNEIVVWGENQDYAINYERGSYLGQYVCHSGMTTGTSCGTVTLQNVAVEINNFENEESGVFEHHLAEFGQVCAQNGDSGGPVFAEHTALGLVSAGTLGLPECKRYLYYPEITEATANMGVHIGERRGAPPVAETLGAHFYPNNFHEAVFDGEVAPHNLATTYYFEYGTTTAYGMTSAKTTTGPGNFYYLVSKSVPAINGNTLYHYRMVATNGAGTVYGEDATATSISWPPKVTTGAYSPLVATKEAIFSGSVDPAGRQTSYWVEYHSASESQITNSKTVSAEEAERGYVITSGRPLSADTEYMFRFVAKSSEGTAYGSWVSFTTPK